MDTLTFQFDGYCLKGITTPINNLQRLGRSFKVILIWGKREKMKSKLAKLLISYSSFRVTHSLLLALTIRKKKNEIERKSIRQKTTEEEYIRIVREILQKDSQMPNKRYWRRRVSCQASLHSCEVMDHRNRGSRSSSVNNGGSFSAAPHLSFRIWYYSLSWCGISLQVWCVEVVCEVKQAQSRSAVPVREAIGIARFVGLTSKNKYIDTLIWKCDGKCL